MIDAELLDDRRASFGPEVRAQRGIVEEQPDLARQRLCVTRRDQRSIRLERLAYAAHIGGDHRFSARHRLEHGVGKRLGNAGQDDDVRGVIRRDDVLRFRTQLHDVVEAERWYTPSAVDNLTPETLFERRWALSLLERLLARLRADYVSMGKADQFQVLETFLMRDGDETHYDVAAARLGITSGALRMSVHRMRSKYGELLRAEIAETVARPEEIEEEIRFLLSILS